MHDLLRTALAGALLIASANTFAHDEPEEEAPPKIWEGTGEAGYVKTTGNTDTSALNIRFNLVRNSEKWRHRFTGTALTSTKDGEKDNERYTAEVQSDYKINEKSWMFGAFRWDSDKFGSYDPQYSLTFGYGRQLMKSDNHELIGEVGAGYRKLEERLTGISESDFIGRFLLNDTWQIVESTAWKNRLLVETGSNNTFTQFNTNLVVSMTDRFAINLGYEWRNNSKLPPSQTEKTDTVTSVNLVYNF